MRENPSARAVKNFYSSFKTWILTTYPSSGERSEEEWEAVTAEDTKTYSGDNDGNDIGHEVDLEEMVHLDLLDETVACNSLYYSTEP